MKKGLAGAGPSYIPGKGPIMSDAEKPPAATRSPLGWVGAMLGQRCPRCWQGQMFRHGLTMNDPCPVCGLIFQREEGYFLGSMYTSYVISVVLISAFFLIATALLLTWNSLTVAVVALVPFL